MLFPDVDAPAEDIDEEEGPGYERPLGLLLGPVTPFC
jgi:hypothetical protein